MGRPELQFNLVAPSPAGSGRQQRVLWSVLIAVLLMSAWSTFGPWSRTAPTVVQAVDRMPAASSALSEPTEEERRTQRLRDSDLGIQLTAVENCLGNERATAVEVRMDFAANQMEVELVTSGLKSTAEVLDCLNSGHQTRWALRQFRAEHKVHEQVSPAQGRAMLEFR